MAKASHPLPNLDREFWIKFNRRVKKSDSGCWIWTGGRHHTRGYGVLRVETRFVLAHRVAYYLRTGVDPGEKCVLHSCDNRLCVNPAHLRLGDHRENMYDCFKKGRFTKGEASQTAKLTEGAVRLIRQFAGKISVSEMAETFKVSTTTIYAVINGRTWRHVDRSE